MSAVLDLVREKDPRFKDIPDDVLSDFLARKEPRFLQNEEFRRENMRLNPSESLTPVMPRTSPVIRSAEATARDLNLKEAVQEQEDERFYTGEQNVAGYGPLQLAKDVAVNVGRMAVTPPITLPRASASDVQEVLGIGGKTGEVLAGLQNATADLAEFFVTPLGAATIGLGSPAIPTLVKRVVAGAFAADMARSLPSQVVDAAEAIAAGDTQETTRRLAGLGITPFFVVGAGSHAILGPTPSLETALKETKGFTAEEKATPTSEYKRARSHASAALGRALEYATKRLNLPSDVNDLTAMRQWFGARPDMSAAEDAMRSATTIVLDDSLPPDMRRRALTALKGMDQRLMDEAERSYQVELARSRGMLSPGTPGYQEAIRKTVAGAEGSPSPEAAKGEENLPPPPPSNAEAVPAAGPESSAVPKPPAVTVNATVGTTETRGQVDPEGGGPGEAVSGFGRGLVSGLYQGMFDRLSAGKYPEPIKNATADKILAEHKRLPFADAEDIQQWVNRGTRKGESNAIQKGGPGQEAVREPVGPEVQREAGAGVLRNRGVEETRPEAKAAPSVGEVIEYREDIGGGKTRVRRGTVTRVEPASPDRSAIPVIETGGKERPVTEWQASGRVIGAEPEQLRKARMERPVDLLDEIAGRVSGAIDPKLIKEADPGWKPTGAAKDLFRSGGQPADVALDALKRSNAGFGIGQVENLADFGALINEQARLRSGWRKRQAEEARKLDELAKESQLRSDFEREALDGWRPKSDKRGTEDRPVQDLAEGQSFKIKGQRAVVKSVRFDEDGRVLDVTVDAGPKYGDQVVGGNEMIKVDSGTVRYPRAKAAVSWEAAKEAAPEPAPATPESSQPGPGMVGLGAAMADEMAKQGLDATSLQNARVAAENAWLHQPAMVGPLRRRWREAFDMAVAKIDESGKAGRSFAEDLINDLLGNLRPTADWENAVLDIHRMDMLNEVNRLNREIAQAYDDGRLSDIPNLEAQKVKFANDIGQFGNLTRLVGSESGRSLASRKMWVSDKLELADMMFEARAMKKGAELRPDEVKRIEDLYKESEASRVALEEALVKSEEKASRIEAELVLKEQALEEARQPKYAPEILEIADRFVQHMHQRGNEARARIRARMQSGEMLASVIPIDPRTLGDLAIIGAEHFSAGFVDLARWTKKMVDDMGEWIRPHLTQIWDEMGKDYDTQLDSLKSTYGTKKAAQVKGAAGKRSLQQDIANVNARLDEMSAQGFGPEINPVVRKLAKLYVQDGIRKLDDLLDVLHPHLQQFFPNITREQVNDAYAGRGEFRQPSMDEVSRTLSDLRSQAQLVTKIREIKAGQPPPRFGVARHEKTQEQRKLTQQLEDAKRQYGVVVTDPASQLKSALDARKTYYRNRIRDLQAQIDARQKWVKQRAPSPTDPELEALKAESEKVKAEFDDIFQPPGLTDEQRIARSIKAVERAIAEKKRRLAEKDFEPRVRDSNAPTNAKLEALRAESDALQAEIDAEKELLKPKRSAEEIADARVLASITKRIAENQRRIATGDISPKRKAPREITNPDILKARVRLRKADEAYEDFKAKLQYEASGPFTKGFQHVKDLVNLQRQWRTSFDVSALGRQALWILVSHPSLFGPALKATVTGIRSKERSAELQERILSSPNAEAGVYDRMKLYLAPLERGRPLHMEEAKMLSELTVFGRWGAKIPGVGASQRAYVLALNAVRAGAADIFYDALKSGKTPTKAELEAVGNYINLATGRGRLGAFESAAEGLATILFSPRLVASRYQLMVGSPLWAGRGRQSSARVRAMIAADYGKLLVAAAAFYGLAKLAGVEVELDPRSGRRFALKFGNTYIDPLAGMAQTLGFTTGLASSVVNAMGRAAIDQNITDGDVKAADGSLRYLSDRAYGKLDPFGKTAQQLRFKLAPIPAAFFNFAGGADPVGNLYGRVELAKELFVPLSGSDLYGIMKEHGVPGAVAIQMLSMLGLGVQQYEPRGGGGSYGWGSRKGWGGW